MKRLVFFIFRLPPKLSESRDVYFVVSFFAGDKRNKRQAKRFSIHFERELHQCSRHFTVTVLWSHAREVTKRQPERKREIFLGSATFLERDQLPKAFANRLLQPVLISAGWLMGTCATLKDEPIDAWASESLPNSYFAEMIVESWKAFEDYLSELSWFDRIILISLNISWANIWLSRASRFFGVFERPPYNADTLRLWRYVIERQKTTRSVIKPRTARRCCATIFVLSPKRASASWRKKLRWFCKTAQKTRDSSGWTMRTSFARISLRRRIFSLSQKLVDCFWIIPLVRLFYQKNNGDALVTALGACFCILIWNRILFSSRWVGLDVYDLGRSLGS